MNVGRALVLAAPVAGGCFYVAPAYEPVPNRPPEIISPTGDLQDIPLLMDRDVRVTVVGSDPEGLPLDFVWIIPVDVPFEPTTSSDDSLWFSVLEIGPDPLLDGQRIEVIVSDGDLEESVSWLVEVP